MVFDLLSSAVASVVKVELVKLSSGIVEMRAREIGLGGLAHELSAMIVGDNPFSIKPFPC